MSEEKSLEDLARERLLDQDPDELIDIIFDLANRLKALENWTGRKELTSSNSSRPPSSHGSEARAKSAKIRKEK